MGKYKANEEYIVFGKPTVFNGRINIAHPDIDPHRAYSFLQWGFSLIIIRRKDEATCLNSHALEKLMKPFSGARASEGDY